MDHTIYHFEIPAEDPKRLAEFYSRLFGWKISVMMEVCPSPNYYFLETGGVKGAIQKRGNPGEYVCNYIAVESVEDYSRKLSELGGKVVVPKSPVPTWGWYSIVTDPEGNVFGLFQEDKEVK